MKKSPLSNSLPGRGALSFAKKRILKGKTLNLSNCNLQLDDEDYECNHLFVNFDQNIQTVEMNCNSIVILPKKLFSAQQIQYVKTLHLVDNKLSKLPEALSQLHYLKEIKLAQNKFAQFPEVLFLLPNLKKLDLSNNLIESLPSEIAILSKLSSLNLSDNVIHKIPLSFAKLPSIKNIDFTNNPLLCPPLFMYLPFFFL